MEYPKSMDAFNLTLCTLNSGLKLLYCFLPTRGIGKGRTSHTLRALGHPWKQRGTEKLWGLGSCKKDQSWELTNKDKIKYWIVTLLHKHCASCALWETQGLGRKGRAGINPKSWQDCTQQSHILGAEGLACTVPLSPHFCSCVIHLKRRSEWLQSYKGAFSKWGFTPGPVELTVKMYTETTAFTALKTQSRNPHCRTFYPTGTLIQLMLASHSE